MKRSLKEVILEILEENNGNATFSVIFEALKLKQNGIRLESKDPQKTIRGILSKLKSDGKIVKKNLNFYLVEK